MSYISPEQIEQLNCVMIRDEITKNVKNYFELATEVIKKYNPKLSIELVAVIEIAKIIQVEAMRLDVVEKLEMIDDGE